MTQIGVGLFTLRSLNKSVPEMLDQVADLGYDGVEFVDRVNRDMDVEAVRAKLDETGLEPIGVHVWLHQLEEELDTLIELYEPLGIDTFGIPYHPESNFRNPRRMEWLVERLNRVADRVHERGFNLVYHPNHWDLIPMFEFPPLSDIPSLRFTDPIHSVSQDLTIEGRRTGGETLLTDVGRRIENELLRRRNTLLDRAFISAGATTDNDAKTLLRETPFGYLLAETDPEKFSFQIDISFFVQQGYDPAEVLPHIKDRVVSIHAKDVRTDQYTPGGWPSFVDPGKGHIDFERLVTAAKDNDIDWVIFENGHATDPVKSITSGIETLQSAGLQA